MANEGGARDVAALELQLATDEEADPERVAELTYQLRQELLDLDVEEVSVRTEGAAPPGTRGGEALAIGGLLVQVSVAVLPALLAILQSWVSRSASQKVRVKLGDNEIEIDGRMSPAERNALVKTFVDKAERG